jgi:3-ketosteroid 9alpha-monooxygenase subunit B
MSRPQYHKLKVAKVIEETADARSVVFDIPAELKESFKYKPGQHLQLRIPCADKPLPRCYSLSSSPAFDEPHRVTVKHIKDGRASGWVCSQLKAGDTLEVMPPAGVFTPRSMDANLRMFAGGSGITPVFSIIRTVLKSGTGRITLLYANRDEDSVIFSRELTELAEQHPDRLQVFHWLDSVQGKPPTQAQISAIAKDWGLDDAECYICGPGIFMDTTAAALYALGVPHSLVHIERFVSLPEDTDEVAAPAPKAAAAGAAGGELEVELDGETHIIKLQPGELLIEAMEAAGLQPPFSCRAGACAACMCHLEEGEVEMATNHVLDESDVEQGWILGCQAIAKSPKVKISYPN